MNSRVRKFFSYYKPYLGLFSADMACAVIASAAILIIPLYVRYITTNLLQVGSTDALHQIYMMGGIMLGLTAIFLGETFSINFFKNLDDPTIEEPKKIG